MKKVESIQEFETENEKPKSQTKRYVKICIGFSLFILLSLFVCYCVYQLTYTPQERKEQITPITPITPITYIWIGDKMPSSYLCLFASISYPHQIIMNPTIISKFTRQLKMTETSDLSKLEHIYYHGGIVSDFDN